MRLPLAPPRGTLWVMSSYRAVALLVVLSLAVVPVVGLATADLSAAPLDKHHRTGLRHQPHRAWRTVAAAIEPGSFMPVVMPFGRLATSEPEPSAPLFVRIPFVPPRG